MIMIMVVNSYTLSHMNIKCVKATNFSNENVQTIKTFHLPPSAEPSKVGLFSVRGLNVGLKLAR